jgi:hypothetical protein
MPDRRRVACVVIAPPNRGPYSMPTYDECAELARLCRRQSHLAQTRDVALELRHMAREYLDKAAKLDGGKRPDPGPENRRLV